MLPAKGGPALAPFLSPSALLKFLKTVLPVLDEVISVPTQSNTAVFCREVEAQSGLCASFPKWLLVACSPTYPTPILLKIFSRRWTSLEPCLSVHSRILTYPCKWESSQLFEAEAANIHIFFMLGITSQMIQVETWITNVLCKLVIIAVRSILSYPAIFSVLLLLLYE